MSFERSTYSLTLFILALAVLAAFGAGFFSHSGELIFSMPLTVLALTFTAATALFIRIASL